MQPNDLHKRFDALLAQYQGILFKIAGSYCPNRDDRNDLVQEMMFQLWRSLPNYNEQFALSTWIYRICLNTAISNYRKSKARKEQVVFLDDLPELPDHPSEKSGEEPAAILEQFIAGLKEFDKALIILYLEGTNQNEIAAIMGMTVTNVSTRIGRIKEALKKKLAQKNSQHDRP